MKKLFTYLAVLMLVVGTGALSTAHGSDITIYDNMYNWDFSQTAGGAPSPPNTYNPNPALENNTVTYGAISNQKWDMESVGYDASTNTLTLTGGWNWVTGGQAVGYSTIQTGDVFLAQGMAQNFGHFVTENAAVHATSLNSLWNYSYVVVFGRDGSNHLDGTYKIYQVDGTAVFNNISQSYPTEAQYYANPYTLASGGTVVYTSTSLTNFTQSSFTDAEGTHYVVNLDLSAISPFLNDGFTSHVTMTCGNDVLAGYAPAPVPGSLLLLGSGIMGLVGVGLRKKASV